MHAYLILVLIEDIVKKSQVDFDALVHQGGLATPVK